VNELNTTADVRLQLVRANLIERGDVTTEQADAYVKLAREGYRAEDIVRFRFSDLMSDARVFCGVEEPTCDEMRFA
jgi:hypothetical protein